MDKRVELAAQPCFSVPLTVQVVEQLVHEDERRLVLGQKLPDHLRRRRSTLLVVFGNDGEAFRAAKLERDVTPRCAAQWRPVPAAPSRERVELRPNEDGRGSTGYGLHSSLVEKDRYSLPARGGGASTGEVVEHRQRVRLAAAKLGREVVDRRGLDLDTREPPDNAAAELAKA